MVVSLLLQMVALNYSASIIVCDVWDRFAALAARMENLIQGNSRDVVDQAYMKLVTNLSISQSISWSQRTDELSI